MLKVVSVEKMRQIEAAADAAGVTYAMMMENAGRAVAERVLDILMGRPDSRVTVLVGPGNNGGDGLVAGRIVALEGGAAVRFYLLKDRSDEDVNFKAVREAGLFVALADNDHDFRVLRNMVASADLVIDALFGIGLQLPLRADVVKVFRNVNQALHDEQVPVRGESQTVNPTQPVPMQDFRPMVIAVDCPSGMDCDTGALDKNAIRADETVTFIAGKPGLFEFPGAAAVGRLSLSKAGVPAELPELAGESRFLVDANYVQRQLPVRPANANKGTFGKGLVVAGSANYVGAPGLAAMAAYRCGTGLVTVGAPGPVVAALSAQFLEPTWLPLPDENGAISEAAVGIIRDAISQYDAVLLGPGWGREVTTRALLLQLLDSFGHNSAPPLVVDADGLNLLSEVDKWWMHLPPNTVITPHPGEMARLAKLDKDGVASDRWALVQAKAAEWKVVLVLKGAHTLIAEPSGRVAVLPFKTDALATAGTGDVLAGVITGFLAQGLAPFEAAVTGGYLHGLAGEQAAAWQGTTRSVIAGDVLRALGGALAQVEFS